jgi:hypothetical protein
MYLIHMSIVINLLKKGYIYMYLIHMSIVINLLKKGYIYMYLIHLSIQSKYVTNSSSSVTYNCTCSDFSPLVS